MRLKSIRLVGFKSFVDPTAVSLRGNLVAVVGPNGCGKSNIVDAVRWVLGESSAKQLRSDEMADVIFNGSSARKPVGQASVELRFDNADGALGGQYANYAEIAVKRQVSRDGQSHYYLNGSRCRRRDITDLFLGTGLGPRSYAIIEQGMVTRLVEAKPEELRTLLEEAAGISRYRERRRETENRIRHTRDNMDRIGDLREELARQLATLERQAQAAQRYRELKAEERDARARLLAARLQQLHRRRDTVQHEMAGLENRREGATAHLRSVEAELESLRATQQDRQSDLARVQESFYAVGADIARAEQRLDHDRGLRDRQQSAVEKLRQDRLTLTQQLAADDRRGATLERELTDLGPRARQAEQRLAAAEAALAEAQQKLTRANGDLQRANAAEVAAGRDFSAAQASLAHLETVVGREDDRRARLTEEFAAAAQPTLAASLVEQREAVQQAQAAADQSATAVAALDQRVQETNDRIERGSEALDAARTKRQNLAGRLASLRALQEGATATGERFDALLAERGWQDLPRLFAAVRVEAPWERAVESVLRTRLGALVIGDLEAELADLPGGTPPEFAIVAEGGSASRAIAEHPAGLRPLRAVISGVHVPDAWLAGVYCVPDGATAGRLRGDLAATESLVDPDGRQWGREWFQSPAEGQAGLLTREREIHGLESELVAAGTDETERAEAIDALRETRRDLSTQREAAAARLTAAREVLTQASATLARTESEAAHLASRRAQLEEEIQGLEGRLAADRDALQAARVTLDEARQTLQARVATREAADRTRGECEQERATGAEECALAGSELNEIALARQGRDAELSGLRESTKRWHAQLQRIDADIGAAQQALADAAGPLRDLETQLQALLDNRARIDAELATARDELEAVATRLRTEQARQDQAAAAVREAAEAVQAAQLRLQEIHTMVAGVTEQAGEQQLTGDDLQGLLREPLDEAAIREGIAGLERRIARLGAINLAAIEERRQVAERKEYLDRQFDDLTQALETMETAIGKIDRETRSRFKETFEKVQGGLQSSFPRLFGGGHASLELRGDDLLTAGVEVTARPPGKRNSSIHQLSGGEKSLTAIALIFAIFDLNPAPFCILDEVDAPLDDANVSRYCELVREMSARVQFVIITHNKTTMALSQHLTGVTMSEPGVSRLVAVDIDDAVEMASA